MSPEDANIPGCQCHIAGKVSRYGFKCEWQWGCEMGQRGATCRVRRAGYLDCGRFSGVGDASSRVALRRRPELPGLAALDAEFVRTINEKTTERIEIYREEMDRSRFGSNYQTLFRDFLRAKYADKKIDAVVAVSWTSARFSAGSWKRDFSRQCDCLLRDRQGRVRPTARFLRMFVAYC